MRLQSVSLAETLRLKELHLYGILHSPPEQEYNDLVQLAAHICGCPIAAISFIDDKRQWFKAGQGVPFAELDKQISFCTHTIQQTSVMIVEDATQDIRFATNPLVVGESAIRFYAGSPIVTANGFHIGSVCVLGQAPRQLDDSSANALQIIARQVAKLLELRLRNTQLQTEAEKIILHQKELVHRTLQGQLEESVSLSTALHENIAQGLTATKLYLEMAEGSSTPALITKCKNNVVLMLEEARSLSKEVFPTTMKNAGVVEILAQQLETFKHKTGIETSFTWHQPLPIHPDQELLFYRMAKEQLKNIEQHAGATLVTIQLEKRAAVFFSITDNGRGLDAAGLQLGWGLKKLLAQVDFYGGDVQVHTAPGKGFRLEVSLPFADASKTLSPASL